MFAKHSSSSRNLCRINMSLGKSEVTLETGFKNAGKNLKISMLAKKGEIADVEATGNSGHTCFYCWVWGLNSHEIHKSIHVSAF